MKYNKDLINDSSGLDGSKLIRKLQPVAMFKSEDHCRIYISGFFKLDGIVSFLINKDTTDIMILSEDGAHITNYNVTIQNGYYIFNSIIQYS